MAARSRIHWRVPTTIAVAFVAGLLFAIGHHLFLASLAGSPLDGSVFNQQQNLAIGSAFAFLVRASLVISIGATFWQVFWRTLLSKGLQIETADALAGLLGSLVDFVSWRVWSRSPLLVFIAATAWLVPFAAIVPPATLTVRLLSHSDYDLMMLKVPDFLGTSMAINVYREDWRDSGAEHWNAYEGPTYNLAKTVTATALDGELPNVPSPAINASYVLSYSAPSILCEHMPTSVLSNWEPIMECDPSLNSDPSAINSTACLTDPTPDYWWPYLSWTPGQDEIVPFSNGSLPGAGDLAFGSSYDSNASLYLGTYKNTSVATLFVAASKVVAGEETKPVANWVALNCSLYNSTYTTNFTFEEGTQTISVLDVSITNPISVIWNTPGQSGSISQNVGINMNYQALMDSLGRLLVGDIAYSPAESLDSAMTVQTEYQTRILQTKLAFTKEMFSIYNSSETYTVEANSSQWYQRPLAEAMEDLFRNMTLSLFSRSEFLRAMDSPTNVTTTTLRNVYEYNWQRLWLAYGLALGVALVVVIVGSCSLAISGVSYSHKLSTILRVTGGDRVDVDIKESDRAGNDPLPEYLSKAELLCRVTPTETGRGRATGKSGAIETSAMIQRRASPMRYF